jgi:selenocysteine lyase/cysteine desulfurase
VPLLVDGAHAPGQGLCRPGRYPLWVGSGHKWLGGPNGTGFVYARPELVSRLEPVWLGDRFYNYSDSEILRFEYQGTADVARWLGLASACQVSLALGPEKIAERQACLVDYLRRRLIDLPAHEIRTPAVASEASGMLTATWSPQHVAVPDLREALWQRYRVWIQPDFFYGQPGHGMRISCHPANTYQDIDRLIEALSGLLI